MTHRTPPAPRTPHPVRTVRDMMTSTVVAVGPAAGFGDIVRVLRQWQVSAVPVVDDEGRVLGVVSEADLLPKEELRTAAPGLIDQRNRLADYAKAAATTARELMTAPAVTVAASAPLPRAAHLMARHQVKRLPVVDGTGTLKGIVSRGDLLKVFLRPDEELAEEVRHEVVDRLFPVSGHGVRVAVDQGTVTLTGAVRDADLVAVAERLARAVDGVVDVRCLLTAPLTGT